MKYDINSFDYIISDTHFGHDNIVNYCFRPGHDHRGYHHDYEKHNLLMVENWQRVVRSENIILHLGDVAMGKGGKEEAEKWISQLPGRKFLIKGNHDKWPDSFYNELGFEVIDPFEFEHDGMKVSYTHYPRRTLSLKEINIHGHLHNNPTDHLTARHRNVGVELTGFSPLHFRELTEKAISRGKVAHSEFDFKASEWEKATRTKPLHGKKGAIHS